MTLVSVFKGDVNAVSSVVHTSEGEGLPKLLHCSNMFCVWLITVLFVDDITIAGTGNSAGVELLSQDMTIKS